MNLRYRLARLERAQVQTPAWSIVCVDLDGLILDDESELIRPWIGRRADELPPSPYRQILCCVNPIVVRGPAD